MGASVDRHTEEARDAVIVRRRGDRLPVGRPSWSALPVERSGHVYASRLVFHLSAITALLVARQAPKRSRNFPEADLNTIDTISATWRVNARVASGLIRN
jgi:hypothetical protein